MKYRHLRPKNKEQVLVQEEQPATSADSEGKKSKTSDKNKPPFTILPSFHVAAVVCSFYGYMDEVSNLNR